MTDERHEALEAIGYRDQYEHPCCYNCDSRHYQMDEYGRINIHCRLAHGHPWVSELGICNLYIKTDGRE